ncbi:serine/arginine repetitive matrix protein 1 [Drosophila ananassae]|nr:serine/arginine repetitive matrix protein 1 [Drosophila ananassae]
MLSGLKIAKLNSENTCTSYYDFLTCGPAYMQSVICKPEPVPARTQPENESPSGLLRNGKKFYGVEDTATQWYVHKRRPQYAKCPKPRMFGYKFRMPIRNALKHKSTTAPYRFSGRRISPEFLCLLNRHHASLPGVNRVSKRYLVQKPSFSYYKFDAEEKNRPMRPGIETAAPVTFPCWSMVCPRRKPIYDWYVANDPYQWRSHDQESQDDQETAKPKEKDTQDKKFKAVAQDERKQETKRDRKSSPGSAHSLPKPQKIREPLLHGLYTTKEPEEIEPGKKPSRHKSTKAAEKKSSSLKSTITVTESYCYPAEKIKEPTSSRTSTMRASSEPACADPKKTRDPRRIEFENQPFFQALKGSNYDRVSRQSSKDLVTCSAPRMHSVNSQDEDNWEVSLEREERREKADYERTGYRVRPEPENNFFKSMCCPRQVGVQRSERPDFYDGTDVEMPPDHPWGCCGYGYEGFIHRSEFQDRYEKKTKRKKPPPYCYLWSAVDPNIREEEKKRLAEIKCQHRRKSRHSSPYFFYWSTPKQNVRTEAKSQLEEMDRESEEEPYPPPPCFPNPKPKCSHDRFNRASAVSFGESGLCESSAERTKPKRSDSYSTWSTGRKGRLWRARSHRNTDDSPFPWGEDRDSPIEEHGRSDHSERHMWGGPLPTELGRGLREKPRFLPRIHAFAKRFLFPGPTGMPLKPNSDRHFSESERSKPSASCRKMENETPYCIRRSKKEAAQSTLASPLETMNKNFRTRASEQPRIQDVRGTRDPSYWERAMSMKRQGSSSPKRNRETFYNPYANQRPSTLSPKREKARKKKKRIEPRNRASSEGPSTYQNYQSPPPPTPTAHTKHVKETSDLDEMPERKRAPSPTSLSSDSSEDQSKNTCKKRESRAQREWEERRQRRKAKKCREGFARTSNDWFLTSRSPDQRHPDPPRAGVLTLRNCEFPREPSDPALIEPRGDRFQFLQHRAMCGRGRADNHQSSTSHCNYDRSRSRAPEPRMRGGIDCRKGDYSRRRRRGEEAHGFPTALPVPVNNKRVHYTNSSNLQKHCFCFD